MLVDSHAHIQLDAFAADREEVLENAQEDGVHSILTIGFDVETSRGAIKLAEQYEQIFAAVGMHPHDATESVFLAGTLVVVAFAFGDRALVNANEGQRTVGIFGDFKRHAYEWFVGVSLQLDLRGRIVSRERGNLAVLG